MCVCALAVGLKYRFGYDDSLDVVGVHLVGGLVGTLLSASSPPRRPPAGVDGLFYGGGLDQLWRQAVGALRRARCSRSSLTYVIGIVIHKTIGFRVTEEDEITGIDTSMHAETAYDFARSAAAAARHRSARRTPRPATPKEVRA